MTLTFSEQLKQRGLDDAAIAAAIAEMKEIVLAEIAAECLSRLPEESVAEIEAVPEHERTQKAIEVIRTILPIEERAEVENLVLGRVTAQYIEYMDTKNGASV